MITTLVFVVLCDQVALPLVPYLVLIVTDHPHPSSFASVVVDVHGTRPSVLKIRLPLLVSQTLRLPYALKVDHGLWLCQPLAIWLVFCFRLSLLSPINSYGELVSMIGIQTAGHLVIQYTKRSYPAPVCTDLDMLLSDGTDPRYLYYWQGSYHCV